MGWTTPATVSVGQTETAALWNTYVRDNSAWDHNLGTLAYAEITASQTGIVGLTTITGLTITPTVVSGRRIKITISADAFGAFSTADAYVVYLYEGASVLKRFNPISTAAAIGSVHMEWVGTPSAGAHTYFVQANHTVGATAGIWYADAQSRSYIKGEDIGV